MDFNKETQEKIKEIQLKEQNSQMILLQKQSFQMELSEIENALSELEHSEITYKLIGQILIKKDKNIIKDELQKTQKILSLRVQSLEKQEDSLSQEIEELRQNIMKSIN
jgi:prefoldin beta subunit